MGRVEYIQNKILELSGGDFERLCNAYLYKKYLFNNIQNLGVQTGTSKPTKGTPDSYVLTENGKYILITCGSEKDTPIKKIKSDILSCLDSAKCAIDRDKIEKIICCHSSSNIHIDQFEDLRTMLKDIKVELIGIDIIAHDLAYKYPLIAKDRLGIALDSHQLFDIDDFVSVSDKSKTTAPLYCDFWFRETEKEEIIESVNNNEFTVILGHSGTGKTRLALEVCRYYKESGWNVYCVKSNGSLLYDDLMCCFDKAGNYLLFFDDANLVKNLKGILDYIYSLPTDYVIKLLITVRDYAQKRVVNELYQHDKPGMIRIDNQKDGEIKKILQKNLGINNPDYLDRIANIAAGNMRIAMLAGKKALDGSLLSIHSIEDLYEHYYGEVIDATDLSKEELLFLCILAISGPVSINNNKLYRCLLSIFLPNVDELNLILRLYELELVDWFKNEVVNIADQSLGDYIVFCVFFKEKWIDLCMFIKAHFPEFRDSVISIINMLINKYPTNEMYSFVEEQIKKAWNASPEHSKAYLESFYLVDPLKSLSILNKRIEEMDSIECTVSQKELDEHKNINTITEQEIGILAGFKYSDYFDEAIRLLMTYFSKRPDLFIDFYLVIINHLLYDKKSFTSKYQAELALLTRIWVLCERGDNYNFTILYLNVVKEALNVTFSYVDEERNGKGLIYGHAYIELTDEIKLIRKGIWEALFVLRENDIYFHSVNNIICNYDLNGLYEDSIRKYIVFDFNSIYPYIEDKNDYYISKLLSIFCDISKSVNIGIDERMMKMEENRDYRTYMLLSCDHRIGSSLEEIKQTQKNKIWSEIRNYTKENYSSLFVSYRFLCETEDTIRNLDSGLKMLFGLLEENEEKYLVALEELWISGATVTYGIVDSILYYLISKYGFYKTKDLISKEVNIYSSEWLGELWEILPDKYITREITSEFRLYFEENAEYILGAIYFHKFYVYDETLIDCLFTKLSNNRELCRKFLDSCIQEEDVQKLFALFEKKEELLYIIYCNTFGFRIDYDGYIFKKLYLLYPQIWCKYVESLKDLYNYDYNEKKIVEFVWNTSNYYAAIEYAFELLSYSYPLGIKAKTILLFGGKIEESRKKQWLLNQLNNPQNDNHRFNKLISAVILAFPEWAADYIIEYLKINKSLEDFKNIPFSPSFQSWTGSEIPLVNRQINFLKSILSKIPQEGYIEHKYYISTEIDKMERYKGFVEIQEYLIADT